MSAVFVLAAQRICDRVFKWNSNRNWKCTSADRYRGLLITTGSQKFYTKSGRGSKLSGVLFQNGTENGTMKCSAASSWFLRATGGFRRQLLREMLSAQKAGQALREMQLKQLQESVRASILCISHDTIYVVNKILLQHWNKERRAATSYTEPRHHIPNAFRCSKFQPGWFSSNTIPWRTLPLNLFGISY